MLNVSNPVKTIQEIMRKHAGTYGDAQRLDLPQPTDGDWKSSAQVHGPG